MEQLQLFDDNLDAKPTVENLLSVNNLQNPAALVDLPYDDIYEVSRKEASRKKPIFFIHKYFARRTTCNFRLMLLSLLLPKHEKVWDHFYKSLTISKNENLKILDPFMGGGTTIFESLRIGANVIGNDLQPLAKFVTTAEILPIPKKRVESAMKSLETRVGKRIKHYFQTDCPECNSTADVMYNFHVNEAISPFTGKLIKLFSSYVIAEKKGFLTIICPECLQIYKSPSNNSTHICEKCNHGVTDPHAGNVTRGKYTCPETGNSEYVRNLHDKSMYPYVTKIIAQEYYCPHCRSHDYKSVSEKDIKLYNESIEEYERLKDQLPIPQQKIPDGYNTKQMINHGYYYFKDMFTKRQLLCLGLLLKEIDEYEDNEVKFWLLLAFSASLEMNNKFCRYQYNAWKISNIFFNHAYVPLTMPVENNVWGTKLGTGTFIKSVNKMLKGKEFNNEIYDIFVNAKGVSEKRFSNDKVNATLARSFDELSPETPLILNCDSRNIYELPDSSIDIVLTDPPYGSNVMYSELIDFFHVWLHQTRIGKEIGFRSELSPKVDEIVVNPVRNQTFEDYASGLGVVFKECHRVIKETGYLVFTFHDSDIKGWFSVLDALMESNFKIVAAYPIHSESRTGAHTSLKESIAFDIFLICTKNPQGVSSNIDLEEIKHLALSETDKIVNRLEKINAEITAPDIENFYISQFLVYAFKNGFLSEDNLQSAKDSLSKSVKELEDLVTAQKIVSKRTGWWSELYNKKLKKNEQATLL